MAFFYKKYISPLKLVINENIKIKSLEDNIDTEYLLNSIETLKSKPI